MEYIAHSSCQQQLEQKGGFCESSSRRDLSLVVSIELDVANFRASVESEIIELCVGLRICAGLGVRDAFSCASCKSRLHAKLSEIQQDGRRTTDGQRTGWHVD